MENEYQAETSWFHLFRSMIDSGDVKALGPHAFTVYCVIKAHTNFSTGQAFPSVQAIVDKSGISKREVLRSLKILGEHGYLAIEKRGRQNVYRLREKVQINDQAGRPSAVATWDYLPTTIKAAQAELKNFLMKGDGEGMQVIQIETLHLNVQIAQASGVVQNNFSTDSLKDPRIRQLAERINALRAKKE
jgi:DNA-binding transcriptional ArsR family regulator